VKKEINMTGWIVASATAVALGAAGAGTLLSDTQDKSLTWDNDVELASVFPEAGQAVRILAGMGSRIGVSIRDLNEDDLKNEDELKTGKSTAGVVVEDVEADSPAQKAGFKAGDVVVEFDGERVRSTRQFMRLVQETPSGRSVGAVLTRDGQRVTLSVQPGPGASSKFWDGSRESLMTLRVPKSRPSIAFKSDLFPDVDGLLGGAGQLGLSVDELSAQLSEYFGVKEGVLVTTVRESSNAAKAGVKAGDVITSLNGGTVASAADLRRRAQRIEGGDEFTLEIVRDRKPMTLKGKVEPLQPRRSGTRTIV
jgi:serine protease Do